MHEDGTRRGQVRLGLTPEQRRAARRSALLDSALDLFGTQGYSSTPVEQICKRAYVSTRNFYEEFRDREDILAALYRRCTEHAMAAGVAAEVGADRDNPLTRERVGAFVHALTDDPRVARVVLLEAVGVSDSMEAVRREAFAAVTGYVADYMRRKWPDHADLAARAGDLAVAQVGGIQAMLTAWLDASEDRPVEDLIESIVWGHEIINRAFDPGSSSPPAQD